MGMDMDMDNTSVIVLEICGRKLDFVRFAGNPSFQIKRFHFWYLFFFSFGATAPQWAKVSSFMMFLDRTQGRTTFGRTPLDE